MDFALTARLDDVKQVLDRQIEYNMAIAEEGMKLCLRRKRGKGAACGLRR